MKRHLPLAAGLLFLLASVCFAQPQATPSPSPKPKPAMSKGQLLKKLSAAETKLWEAWKNKNVGPFKSSLSSDFVMLSEDGVSGKGDTLKTVADAPCVVKSYALSDWKLTMINSGAALLTYKGTQDATCGGQAAPPKIWASSVWVNRGGKWQGFSHQETPGK